MTIDANLLMLDDEEKRLYKKYCVSFSNGRRIYEIDLNEKRYDLSSSIPFQLNIFIGGKSYKINDSSWSNLLLDTFNLLQSQKPRSIGSLLSFELSWSKTILFEKTATRSNVKKTECGLFMYCGFTSVLSYLALRELLSFYNVNEGAFFVLRMPFSEPIEIVDYLTNKRKALFEQYIRHFYMISEAEAKKVVRAFDSFNKLLTKRGYGYNNLYLIEDNNVLSNYSSKLLNDIHLYTTWSDREYEIAEVYVKTFKKFKKYEWSIYLNMTEAYNPFSNVSNKVQPFAVCISNNQNEEALIRKFKRFYDEEENKNKAHQKSAHLDNDEEDIFIKYKNVINTILNMLSKSSVPLTSKDIANFITSGGGDKKAYLSNTFPIYMSVYKGVFSAKTINDVIKSLINKKYVSIDDGGHLTITTIGGSSI